MKNKKTLENIKRLLESAENNLKAANSEITEILGESVEVSEKSQDFLMSGRIIEGKFDGEQMIGDDGKIYPVPANYASKSKMVAGDQLKLTISKDGTFIFKQIGPVARKKLVGQLTKSGDQYCVEVDKEKFKVLTASITYFKGTVGDKVTVTVPESGKSSWAAVEAIISN